MVKLLSSRFALGRSWQIRHLSLALSVSLAVSPLFGSLDGAAEAKGLLGVRASINQDQLEPRSTALAAELMDNGDAASLDFTLSAPVDASAFVMAEPDRVIIDLPAVAFKISPQSNQPANPASKRAAGPARPAHLIDSFRFGSFAPGKSRIVIDLSGPARVIRTDVSKIGDKDGYRLLIQLGKIDRASFLAAAHTAHSSPAAAEPVKASNPETAAASAALPRIIIDPGHGGVDSGAMTGGLIEKSIVLDFAKALAAKLTATGHYAVVLTRSDDTFISLGDRVKMARDSNAALFISVHADTLSETDVTGATVYTVSDKASDSQAARVAEKENQSDAVAGVEGKDDANGVSDILFDLTRRETRAYSHVFSHTLANYWKVAARLNKNPERSAGFKVLTAPDVPSVLLELGYLSNEKDVAALNSLEWRDKTTLQVANAIETFFAARGKSAGEAQTEPASVMKPSTSAQLPATATLVSEVKPAETVRGAQTSH